MICSDRKKFKLKKKIISIVTQSRIRSRKEVKTNQEEVVKYGRYYEDRLEFRV